MCFSSSQRTCLASGDLWGHAAGWGPLLRCDVGVAADPCGKHATYAELSAGGPQRLVVLGAEVGGRWNDGAQRLLRDLVRLRAQRATSAWARRWSGMLAVAVQQAVAGTAPGPPLGPQRPWQATGAAICQSDPDLDQLLRLAAKALLLMIFWLPELSIWGGGQFTCAVLSCDVTLCRPCPTHSRFKSRFPCAAFWSLGCSFQAFLLQKKGARTRPFCRRRAW